VETRNDPSFLRVLFRVQLFSTPLRPNLFEFKNMMHYTNKQTVASVKLLLAQAAKCSPNLVSLAIMGNNGGEFLRPNHVTLILFLA
jgi:hypothetical protein